MKESDAVALVRADIRALGGYTPGEQHEGATKLNTNECAWPPSPRVRETLAGIADESLRLYPDPVSRRLREAAAARFGLRAEQVLAGNGSDDCLTVLCRTFLDAGAPVAVPWPTYGLYDTLASLQGARMIHVAYRRMEGTWELPAEALASAGGRLTFVANPNNPSATLAPVAVLRRLADDLAGKGVLVVDEAYVDFAAAPGEDGGAGGGAGAGVGANEASVLPYLDAHPNLVVLRTFSKSYSLAGARLGLMFAAAPLIAEMTKVKDSYNVNVITQALGTAALGDPAYHADVIRRTIDERARLGAALGAGFGWTWPRSAANFLLAGVGPRAGDIYRALRDRKILVRWWNTPELAMSLRITIGRPAENDALVAALRDLV